MSDPAELAVPLALGIPSLLLLLLVFLLPRRDAYQRLPPSPALSPSRLPEIRQWALLLASVGLAVTCFYTLATQIALSHPEEHPLDLLTILSTRFDPERSKLPTLAADFQTTFAPDSNESLALANATHIVSAGLAALTVPPSFTLPSLPTLPSSPSAESVARIEGDAVIEHMIPSFQLPPTATIDPPSASPADPNQTSYIDILNGMRLNVSGRLSQFLGATRAYDVYGGNSSVQTTRLIQNFATNAATQGNVFGPVQFSGPGSFGTPMTGTYTPPAHDLVIDSRARVSFVNVGMVYVFEELGQSYVPELGDNAAPGFWAVDTYYPDLSIYPQGLPRSFLQLTDNLGYQRPGEPSVINNPSVFQLDSSGRKLAYFVGPMIIDPSLSTTDLVSDTIYSTNVTVNGTLAYKTLVSLSDARFKYDIELVNRRFYADLMRPVTFKWKSDDTEATGFIAQDVERELPACEIDNGLDTVCLVAYQFASMRALSDRITMMNDHAETLGRAIKNRFAALEKAIGVQMLDRLGYENVRSYFS
jgi:hypothetical protein